MTVYEFVMNITSVTGKALPPIDVYNLTSILTFQGVIIKVLSLDSTVTNALPPDTLNYEVPLQLEIINYLYYKSNQLLTPSTGYTNTTDYTLSNKVSLTILLVFQGFTSSSEVDALTSFIESNAFPAYMQYVLPVHYNGNKYAVTVDHHSHTTATQTSHNPLN